MFFEKITLNTEHKGYTLSEMLLAMGIIGVISLLTIPRLIKSMPKHEKEMKNKISYVIENTVANMYEDNQMYPKSADVTKDGFFNTDLVYVDNVAYGSNGTDNSSNAKRKRKFCQLFASKFKKLRGDTGISYDANTEETSFVHCTDEAATPPGTPTFIASDGSYWYIPVTDFKTVNSSRGYGKGYARIIVDVNGAAAPNCYKSDDGTTNCPSATLERMRKSPERFYPDQYMFYVKYNGTVTHTNPIEVSDDRSFAINLIVTSKKNNGNTYSNAYQGGSVNIAKIKTDGSTEAAQTSSSAYKNLKQGTSYMLTATPNDDFTSNWSNNQRKISIQNDDVTVKLIFTEKAKNTIILNIRGCGSGNINDCLETYNLQKDCVYKKVADGTGSFKWDVNSNSYVYASQNDTGANYDYICTGNAAPDNSNSTQMRWVNRTTGDYAIVIKPKCSGSSGYTIKNIRNGKYIQNVRLGTSDLVFDMRLTATSTCP